MDDQTLGGILEGWKSEVENQKVEFARQAGQIVKWDEQLRRARVHLLRLSEDVRDLKQGQDEVDLALSAIETHQTRMDDLLKNVEDYMDSILRVDVDHQLPVGVSSATKARAEAYTTAMQVDALLVELSKALTDVTSQINAEQAEQSNDPVSSCVANFVATTSHVHFRPKVWMALTPPPLVIINTLTPALHRDQCRCLSCSCSWPR